MKQMGSEEDFGIIDTVVNIWTPEALKHRPDWRTDFFVGKLGVDKNTSDGVPLDQLLEKMDEAGIEKAFLIATRAGPVGHPSCYRIPYELVAETCAQVPDRLYGLAGIDPLDGMDGVYDLESAVKEMGFIGAHFYPHWFEISPDAAKVYPFYAKCVELDIPIQLQVGQSMNYDKNYPRRSVGRPIALDPVACDFPQLKLIGIHIGIPWAEEMIAMAWKHQNVFIGSDAHSPKYWPESFKHYANTYGQDKVLFGTDFPVLDFKRTLAEIDALGLEKNSKRNLLRENALRVYRLNY